jgi:hypothetical protein
VAAGVAGDPRVGKKSGKKSEKKSLKPLNSQPLTESLLMRGKKGLQMVMKNMAINLAVCQAQCYM